MFLSLRLTSLFCKVSKLDIEAYICASFIYEITKGRACPEGAKTPRNYDVIRDVCRAYACRDVCRYTHYSKIDRDKRFMYKFP